MKNIVLMVGMWCCFIICANAQSPRITFTRPQFYPEGVAYDKALNTFFMGSVKTGTIGRVDMRGHYNDFYVDASLKSSFGMKVDAKRNLLWVCTGDPNYSIYKDSATTFKKLARVIALDITTGKKMKDIDLSALYNGKHFLNDLSLDNLGNVYITDSYSPVIYKIDTDGHPSVFAQNDMFKGMDIGLNGIVWHPDNYLLVVNNSNGNIIKVDMNGNTNEVKVKNFFPGADGILIDEQKRLVLVQNKGINKVFLLESKDNWATGEMQAATAAEDIFQNPSTCTIANGKVYAINAKLNELQDPSIKPSEEFSIQLAVFKPVK